MPYSFASAWEEQVKEMEAQDKADQFKMRNNIYPNGLFNLTSNPLFELYSFHSKLCAINTILRQQRFVKQGTIYYDDRSKDVYFDCAFGLHHRCTLNNQQVQLIE